MNDKATKKIGRPVGTTKKNTADQQLPRIRVTQAQLDAYRAKSEETGKTLSGWVKDTLDKETKSR